MIIQRVTGSKSCRSYRAMAIDPKSIAAITLLDPIEFDGKNGCTITFHNPVCVGIDENQNPIMERVIIADGKITYLAKDAGLDPDDELMDRDAT